MDERLVRSRERYERAVFEGDVDGLDVAERELDGLDADLALARGRLAHARFLGLPPQKRREDPAETEAFERAAEGYRRVGDVRGEAEALLWLGILHQVVRGDDTTAVPCLRRSRELALEVGDRLTVSYALRHLGIAEHAAGRLTGAREHLSESTRIRRELGFNVGVAANLVGLAYVAAAEGHRDDALAHLDEATALASPDARVILEQIADARAAI